MTDDPKSFEMLGRIDERTAATAQRMEAIERKLDGVAYRQDLTGFVPRSEIEAVHRTFGERLTKVEGNQSKAAWAIVSAWIAGVGTVGGMIFKMAGGA